MALRVILEKHVCYYPQDIETARAEGEVPVWIDDTGTEYWCFCSISTVHLEHIWNFLQQHPTLEENLPIFDIGTRYVLFREMLVHELRVRGKTDVCCS